MATGPPPRTATEVATTSEPAPGAEEPAAVVDSAAVPVAEADDEP
ncbi:MAG TPA: hypothetical protein VEY93_07630 [Longimicrobium sp.]|nr:hypothetical protein [Longimicrobium sp.]